MSGFADREKKNPIERQAWERMQGYGVTGGFELLGYKTPVISSETELSELRNALLDNDIRFTTEEGPRIVIWSSGISDFEKQFPHLTGKDSPSR